MILLDNILNHAKESFEFNLTHKYSCIDLGIVTIFDLQIKLEKFKDYFKDIDLRIELDIFLKRLKLQEIIFDYEYENESFYIKPTKALYDKCNIRLRLPTYNKIA